MHHCFPLNTVFLDIMRFTLGGDAKRESIKRQQSLPHNLSSLEDSMERGRTLRAQSVTLMRGCGETLHRASGLLCLFTGAGVARFKER